MRRLRRPTAFVLVSGEVPREETHPSFDTASPGEAQSFAARLEGMPAGKAHWSAYQRLYKDILDYLLCPPLSASSWESSNAAEVSRRDLVYPNYADMGFWRFLRHEYRAD